MSGKYFFPGPKAKEIGLVELFLRVTFGASGDPTLDTTHSKGITSITRSAAGKYVIVLADSYARLMHVSNMILEADDPAAPVLQLIAEDVDSATSPQFTIQCLAADAATATDPASGEEFRMKIVLKDSIV